MDEFQPLTDQELFYHLTHPVHEVSMRMVHHEHVNVKINTGNYFSQVKQMKVTPKGFFLKCEPHDVVDHVFMVGVQIEGPASFNYVLVGTPFDWKGHKLLHHPWERIVWSGVVYLDVLPRDERRFYTADEIEQAMNHLNDTIDYPITWDRLKEELEK